MNSQDKHKLQDWVAESKGYLRLPPRLAESYGFGKASEAEDAFGGDDRLRAIAHVQNGSSLGNMIDLGGHSGFFSLSLVDAGLAESSVVYDVSDRALDAGRLMARELGIERKVTFVKTAIDLEFIRNMPAYDTILSLNLAHHAGALYDVEKVCELGWEGYVEQTLAAMRTKCRTAVFGVGIKGGKPVHVSTDRKRLAASIEDMAVAAGFDVRYSANVQDIHERGAAEAEGAYKRKGFIDDLLSRFPGLPGAPKRTKRRLYYIYVLK